MQAPRPELSSIWNDTTSPSSVPLNLRSFNENAPRGRGMSSPLVASLTAASPYVHHDTPRPHGGYRPPLQRSSRLRQDQVSAAVGHQTHHPVSLAQSKPIASPSLMAARRNAKPFVVARDQAPSRTRVLDLDVLTNADNGDVEGVNADKDDKDDSDGVDIDNVDSPLRARRNAMTDVSNRQQTTASSVHSEATNVLPKKPPTRRRSVLDAVKMIQVNDCLLAASL
eukprot:m.167523 g.167523  ORF g.167523 m.167523 type:complete len:225 (+) comp16640_c0_seq2:655-1329(+)